MIGSCIDNGYEIALQEMVGELVIEHGGPVRIYTSTLNDLIERATPSMEQQAMLLYFLCRSVPFMRAIKAKLIDHVHDPTARLLIAIEVIRKVTGLPLTEQLSISANNMIYNIVKGEDSDGEECVSGLA